MANINISNIDSQDESHTLEDIKNKYMNESISLNIRYESDLIQIVDIFKLMSFFDTHIVLEMNAEYINFSNIDSDGFICYEFIIQNNRCWKYIYKSQLENKFIKLDCSILSKCLGRFKGKFDMIFDNNINYLDIFEELDSFRKLRYQINYSDDIPDNHSSIDSIIQKHLDDNSLIVFEFKSNMKLLYGSMRGSGSVTNSIAKEVIYSINNENQLVFDIIDSQTTESYLIVESVNTMLSPNNYDTDFILKFKYNYEHMYKILNIFKQTYNKKLENVTFSFSNIGNLLIEIDYSQYNFFFLIAPIHDAAEEEDFVED